MENGKKRYSPEEKMMILRELLENKVPLSDLAEKYKIHPNVIYNWRKELFEQGSSLFKDKRIKEDQRLQDKIESLETKLKVRNDMISELLEDNIRLKKNTNGDR